MESSIEQTSSIGAAWPPTPASNERIRGFYTDGVITSQAESGLLADYLHSAIEQVNISEAISRVSIRVVAELATLERLNFGGIATLEAVLPIADTDLGIVYIGQNAPHREMNSEYSAAHIRLLEGASRRMPAHISDPIDIRVVNPDNVSDLVNEFTALYTSFGYDSVDTESLLSNQANTIAYAVADGRVVSTAMAEQGTVNINGYGDLTLFEITEASTHPDYRQRHLYQRVSGYLINRLTEMRRESPSSVDVIYGESNLAMPGVIYAAHLNGRRFSYLDRERLGIQNKTFGILPQNFKINDGVELRAYNDFAVSYLPL